MSVKIGFIGVGGIAQSHINNLKKIDNATIVSVYDINREGAENVAASLGARVANSSDELLNPNEIDAVFICTPQFARDELEETAARRGIHMLVEKPLGLDLEAVSRKEKTIRESGVLHSVGYCLRYYDTVLKAKEYLDGKQIHAIQAFRFGTSHPAKWWRTQDMSGGHLVDAVTHQVDMIRFLAGEFRDVYAQFGRNSILGKYPDATIADAGAVSFSMQSGAVGTITESCVSPYHGGSEIKIFGLDFFVHISGNGKSLTIIDSERKETITSEQSPSLEQDRAFVNAVASGSGNGILCGYGDGLRTLAFTLAANQSAENQQAVRL